MRTTTFFQFVLFTLALLRMESAHAQALIPPEPVPNGDTAFVGSVSVTFSTSGTSKGQIWYTLTGLAPTAAVHILYADKPILIEKTTTLKALRYQLGSSNSTVTTAIFRRAKLPAPVAHYGMSPYFSSSLICTLQVPKEGISPFIRYTTDGTLPNDLSPLYSVPLTFTHSTLLRAFATTPGYDNSEPMQVQFTQLGTAAIPVATPGSQTFTSKTLTVKLKSASTGVQFRYSLDTNVAPSAWPTAWGDTVLLVGNTPGETIVLRAQAFKAGTYFPSPYMTEKFTYTPQVRPITTLKYGAFFYDTVTISLSTGTLGASIRYSLDGAQPLPTSTLWTGPLQISDSVTLTAIAFKPPQPQSATLKETYRLRLTPPGVDRSTQQFQDSLSIKLNSPCPGAKIYYTLDGSPPTGNSTLYTGAPIGISQDNTVLSAIAIKGGIKSPPSQNTYTKIAVITKLSIPTIIPVGREFVDTLVITLQSEIPGTEIRYTLDETNPTSNSPLYTTPFSINSTAILRVQAFSTSGNFEPSDVREAKYTLLPSVPTATPSGGSGPFLNQVQVTLKTSTNQGLVHYALGDKTFDLATAKLYNPGELITLKTSTTLQAMTILGTGAAQQKSGILTQVYEIYAGLQTDTLPAGASTTLKANIVFTNSSTVPILATVHSTLALGIIGFANAGLAIQLQSIPAGKPMNVTFSKPATQTQSLYRTANGIVEFVSASAQFKIVEAGDYFVGTDTFPPVITLLSQAARIGDSTSIRLWVRDNVSNPNCEITSDAMPGGKLVQKPDGEGLILTAFKNPGTEPKGLWFRAQAADFYNTTRFPKDPMGKFFLSQSWNNLVSPETFSVGNKEYPWDMVGLPINAKAPITWAQLKNDNLDADLSAMVLNGPSGYKKLADDSLIRPGMSFWLGSLKPVASLAFSNFKAGESDSSGAYRLTLHHGWNQISSPALEKLYWPIPRTGISFSNSPVKGLHEFIPSLVDYVATDSMVPWKGYFVYSYGDKDTTLSLFTEPGKALAPKVSGTAPVNFSQTEEGVEIGLDFGRPVPLTLGATQQGQDAFSKEDEPQLPAWKPTYAAWSQRNRHQLAVDILHFSPQALLKWNVVIAQPEDTGDRQDKAAVLRISKAKLPVGYQAWAISRKTRIKYRLEQDGTIPILGARLGAREDSITIYAGPLAKLAEVPELSVAVSSVERFSLKVEKDSRGQLYVNVALPWKCQFSVSVWRLAGQLETKIHPRELTEGLYRFPLAPPKSPGMAILQIVLQGKSVNRTFTQKVLR